MSHTSLTIYSKKTIDKKKDKYKLREQIDAQGNTQGVKQYMPH